MAKAEATIILAAVCARFDISLAPCQVTQSTTGISDCEGIVLHLELFLKSCEFYLGVVTLVVAGGRLNVFTDHVTGTCVSFLSMRA